MSQIGDFDICVNFVNMMASIVQHKYPSSFHSSIDVLDSFLICIFTFQVFRDRRRPAGGILFEIICFRLILFFFFKRVSDLAGTFLKKKWTEKLSASSVSRLLEKYLEGKPAFPTISNLIALLPELTGDNGLDSPKQVGSFACCYSP